MNINKFNQIQQHLRAHLNACMHNLLLSRYSWLFVSDMSPKSIYRKCLGQSHTGTKQKLNEIYHCSHCYATVKIQKFFANSGTFHGLLVCGLAASHSPERCWVMANSSASLNVNIEDNYYLL